MTERSERGVLLVLQALVLCLPLFLGGRQPIAAGIAASAVLGLLAATIVARRRCGGGPAVPGLGALTAFVALALATTVPLPPAALSVLSPASARVYAATLPGWPGAGGWTVWRSIAIDPYAVWVELGRLAIGLGAFVVVAAYPWGNDPSDRRAQKWAYGRLLLTLIAGGVLLASLGLVHQVLGGDSVLWITGIPASPGRASGPFVNPNHLAAWLEMVLPAAAAYGFSFLRRVRRGVVRSARAGRGMGVSARRAWVSALVVHQQRLWGPVVVLAAVLLLAVGHAATGSRGGTAALLVGLAVTVAGMLASGRSARRRWLPVVLAGALCVASAGSIVAWALADAGSDAGNVAQADVSLASRLAVSVEGMRVIRDYPVLGSGLGSWLHAFRPHVEPPIEGGIWDHAHDDYVELTAETGLLGAGLVLLFAVAVIRALRPRGDGDGAGARAAVEPAMPRGFRRPDWSAALGESGYVRWGIAGGIAAILVHSLVDFGLHLPGNMLVAMTLVGLLLSGRLEPVRRAPALGVLLALFALALVPQATNAVLVVAGRSPLSPRDCREAADLMVAEQGPTARGDALRLLHRSLDWSPADREAHQQLADLLGPGRKGDAELRIALALEPWSAEVRDQLGMRLLDRDERSAGLAELEESMYRFPYLASHAYLSPDSEQDATDATRLIRALADGDTITLRLSSLSVDVADAVERGLTRAFADARGGEERASILADKVALLEARERWADAAAVLKESSEEDRGTPGALDLAHAGRDYLKALDFVAAERAMLGALMRTPEQGDLYRDLAVEVYASRGDYTTADDVLDAGQRNAIDMLSVYDGVTTVLERREMSPDDDFVGPPRPRDEHEDEIP